MISFIVPNGERDFNLNSVARNNGPYTLRPSNGQTGVTSPVNIVHAARSSSQFTNGPARVSGRDLRSSCAAPSLPRSGRTSPNNNSYRAPSCLDNRPSSLLSPRQASLSLTADLAMMDDSSSDDTTSGSLAAQGGSDELLSPPAGLQKRSVPPPAASTRSGKLKRVSFGSSKGSMVETLIYDYEPGSSEKEEVDWRWPPRRPGGRHAACLVTSTPVRPTAAPPHRQPPRPEEAGPPKPTSRVRVTYYESRRPLSVSGSEGSSGDVVTERRQAAVRVTAAAAHMPTTHVVTSVDAGWENPFRPGGELSKEADQIVRAIQSGRPLDASLDTAAPSEAATALSAAAPPPAGNGHASPPANGALPASAAPAPAPAPAAREVAPPQTAAQPPGTVEVHHSVIAPEGASEVERVALKKKHRGRCCVVQ